jgi:toxin ParE1/3/4
LKLVWLPRAIANRDAQLDYIAQDNPKAAIEQGDRIAQQIRQLIAHPELGRPGRKQGTRELVISRTPFIAVYRVKPKARRIELMRVLHGSQQWRPDEREMDRPTRPDKSAAPKATHEAAAYDKLFRSKVQEAIDDTRPAIPHDQVMADTRALINRKVAEKKADNGD